MQLSARGHPRGGELDETFELARREGERQSLPRQQRRAGQSDERQTRTIRAKPAIMPRVEAVNEIQVQTLNFASEFGRGNGSW